MRLSQELRNRLLTDDAAAWKDITTLLMKCARIGTWKAGAAHLVDDVVSEVLLLLRAQLLRRMPDGMILEPFLIEVCRRVSLSMRRSRNEDRLVSNDADDGGVIFDEPSSDFTEELEVHIEAERAKARIRASVDSSFWKQPSGTHRAQANKSPKPRAQYGCGDHDFARRLKAERKRRGWTQKQMAAYMGLGLPTYISYEHACVINPNPMVVKTLELMLKETF